MMNETNDTSLDLVGVGSPLVDLVAEIDDATLAERVPGAKGGMELVDLAVIEGLITDLGLTPSRSPGGAAANTTTGAACLGLRTAFIGSCGDDEGGAFYRERLLARGCDDRLVTVDGPTGRVLSLVTPDAERTMRTCLGAAAMLTSDHVTAASFAGARLAMLEGYTLFNHDLARAVAAAAAAAGCRMALDLASFEVVSANRAVLAELLDGPVDIVFANEDEAQAWNSDGIEAALDDLAARCAVAVVKLGADGAWIASGSERHRIACQPVEQVVDTTGAGDTWAAGFLAAHLRGLPLPAAGELAAKAAAAVVQVPGALVPTEAWVPLRGWLEAWQ